MAQIVFEVPGYQVVDAGAWHLGFTVDKYDSKTNSYSSVAMGLSKDAAIEMAKLLSELDQK